MFSTYFIFRQQENLVDNQKSQAGFRPLRNKILFQKEYQHFMSKENCHYFAILHKGFEFLLSTVILTHVSKKVK